MKPSRIRAIEQYAKAELEQEEFREAVEHRKDELRSAPRSPWWHVLLPFTITITWRN